MAIWCKVASVHGDRAASILAQKGGGWRLWGGIGPASENGGENGAPARPQGEFGETALGAVVNWGFGGKMARLAPYSPPEALPVSTTTPAHRRHNISD